MPKLHADLQGNGTWSTRVRQPRCLGCSRQHPRTKSSMTSKDKASQSPSCPARPYRLLSICHWHQRPWEAMAQRHYPTPKVMAMSSCQRAVLDARLRDSGSKRCRHALWPSMSSVLVQERRMRSVKAMGSRLCEMVVLVGTEGRNAQYNSMSSIQLQSDGRYHSPAPHRRFPGEDVPSRACA